MASKKKMKDMTIKKVTQIKKWYYDYTKKKIQKQKFYIRLLTRLNKLSMKMTLTRLNK